MLRIAGQSTGRNSEEKTTGGLSCSPTWPSLVQSHPVSHNTSAFLPATLPSAAPSLPAKPSLLVQRAEGGRKQAQQSKGCAEIKSSTIQPLSAHCSATWVEATGADVLIWRWLGQTARSCEPDWWREDMGRSGGETLLRAGTEQDQCSAGSVFHHRAFLRL